MKTHYQNIGHSKYGDILNNGNPIRETGWGPSFASLFGAYDSDSDKVLADWFRKTYNIPYFNDLSNADLASILSNKDFWETDFDKLGIKTEYLNKDIVDKYISQLEDYDKILGEMPTAPNLGDIRDEAYAKMEAENNELLAMLDDDLARQQGLYQSELNDINSMYGDLRRQTLENSYRNNAALMGTVGSEMSKARRNALESGASAGLRLAENINTLLSVQNKQSQQSLETSNQLAQQLLNQRQAAMGVRSAWGQAQSANTNSKIGIKQGTAERAENYANNRFNTENTVYNNDMQQWEDKYNTVSQGNPFAESYRNYYRKNQYGY